MTKLSRRNVLKGAAGLTFALPLLPSLQARADTPVFPKRLLIFYHPNGVLPGQWFPTAGASETEFTFSPTLEPLEPFKDDVLILEGVGLKCNALGPGEPHQKGMGGLLTGWHLNPGNMIGGDGSLAGWAKGISLDQRVAQVIGTETKLGSLLLGVRPRGGDVRHHLSYAGDSQPLPVIGDPQIAWNQIFNNLSSNDPESIKRRRRRTSVLDQVRVQLGSLANTLPASERGQLDQHLSLVQDLEGRLAATINVDACDQLPQPPAMATDSSDTMPDLSTWQIDLMAMAFACDATRVGVLQFGQADNQLTFPWLNSWMDGHGLSHLGDSDAARPEIGWRDHWYAERFAYLLQKLKSIPEGDGTVLDHTQILWVNELGVGNSHSQTNLPIVLAGHAAGFRTGRFVQYMDGSHSNLLLSVLHGMGVHDETFGNPDITTGELSGLL